MGRRLTLLMGILAGLSASAAAQTVGTPVFMAPYRAFTTSELSATISDPGGSGWALEGAYRYGSGRWDVGLRGGFWNIEAAADDDDLYLLAGVDFRIRVIEHTEEFPLDGAFTFGIGAAFGDNSFGLVPLGLSLGRRVAIENSSVSFVPYLQPVLGITFGDDPNALTGTSGDAIFALGLGVDFKLSSRFDIRLTGGIGDIEGIGIGFAWVR